MLLSRSMRRKFLANALAAIGFVLLYQATMIDSRSVPHAEALPDVVPGAKIRFSATAYCKGTTTASGVAVRKGVIAADPKILPQGSVVQLSGLPEDYEGIYTVMDTGPKIQGRIIDVYMWSCHEALRFGRRPVRVEVLRLGWKPKAEDAPIE
jgi:3D (Asp-Asp-Asp) domain-containing protein